MAVSVLCLQQLLEEAGCCETQATRLSCQLTQVSQEQVANIQGSYKQGCRLDVHHGWVKVPETFCSISDSVLPMSRLHLRITCVPPLRSAALCDGSYARSQQAGMSVKHSRTLQRNQLSSRKESKLSARHSICTNELCVSADEADEAAGAVRLGTWFKW